MIFSFAVMVMMVPESLPQFSEHKFKQFAMRCRLTHVFPSSQYTQSNGSKNHRWLLVNAVKPPMKSVKL